jgi:hypothetical protein
LAAPSARLPLELLLSFYLFFPLKLLLSFRSFPFVHLAVRTLLTCRRFQQGALVDPDQSPVLQPLPFAIPYPVAQKLQLSVGTNS